MHLPGTLRHPQRQPRPSNFRPHSAGFQQRRSDPVGAPFVWSAAACRCFSSILNLNHTLCRPQSTSEPSSFAFTCTTENIIAPPSQIRVSYPLNSPSKYSLTSQLKEQDYPSMAISLIQLAPPPRPSPILNYH